MARVATTRAVLETVTSEVRMSRHIETFALAAVAAGALAIGARPAQAQQQIAGSPALKAQAKVSGDSAIKIAHARVPKGTMTSGQIEEQKGRLVYAIDLQVPGKSGVEEVLVDAKTGKVVGQKHETPEMERKEAHHDSTTRSMPTTTPPAKRT